MAAKGCSSVFGIASMIAIFGGIVGYSLYIDYAGILISGKVWRKSEVVHFHYDSWSRQMAVTATYQPAGETIPSYASTDVDASTFDHLRVGSPVMVRYLPSRSLRDFILIPSARLAGRGTFSFLTDHIDTVVRVLGYVAGFAALFFLWRKAGIPAAGWLLLLLGGMAAVQLVLPHEEPAPAGPVQTARATVKSIAHVTEILESRRHRGTQTLQPYDMVDLEFVPAGRTEPVHAVDKLDAESLAGLQKGAVVEVTYAADNPRIARIQGGTRTFPRKAMWTLALLAGALVLLFLVVAGVGSLLSRAGRNFRKRLYSPEALAQRQRLMELTNASRRDRIK